MSNYTKSTNFATKDALSSGNPLKIVKGTEIDTEFNNIATAISTKTDNANAAITGGSIADAAISGGSITGTAISGGSITGITDLAVTDGGTGASNASGARTNLGAAASGSNSDITSITGLTTPLAVSQGGTGSTSITANNVILGNGTSAVQVVAPGTTGNILTSNGTTWASSAPPSIVPTSVTAIGSIVVAAINTTSYAKPGDTVAGSNCYYVTTTPYFSSSNDYISGTAGANGSAYIYTSFPQAAIAAIFSLAGGNTGWVAPNGTTALTGTWRHLFVARPRDSSYDGCSNQTSNYTYMTLIQRVS
jgi:hypothetical protein